MCRKSVRAGLAQSQLNGPMAEIAAAACVQFDGVVALGERRYRGIVETTTKQQCREEGTCARHARPAIR